ncbi:MAG TPA: glycosyltransferase [Rhodospirillales bacterium]|nr:glycosyltransferase [Rhodospirillales bacterium]
MAAITDTDSPESLAADAAVASARPGPRAAAHTPASTPLDAPLSVVVLVDREPDDIASLHRTYREATRPLAPEVEFIYVVDGPLERAIAALRELARQGEPLSILTFPKAFGEASALSVAFREARGGYILTLPVEIQVEPEELPTLAAAIADVDLVVCRRLTERPLRLGRSKKLEYLSRLLLGSSFEDLRCGVRLLRRSVADELVLYGNQHRFLPLLAQTQGFLVREVPVRGRVRENRRPRLAVTLLLDLLTVYFLLRFVQKPFRFFGGFGMVILGIGGLVTAWLVIERLFFGVGLADRPALVLSTLTIVLGIQIIAVGLIGEIIAFAHARNLKDYKIEKILE